MYNDDITPEGTTNMLTTAEFRLFFAAAVAMMASMLMLLCVMFGIVDPDTVRTPLQVTGLCAIALFAGMRIMQWFRLKRA